MRLHIHVEDSLMAQVDAIAGRRRRSAFVREALRVAVERYRRLKRLDQAAGSIEEGGHDWDSDPAAWVRSQRLRDPRRTG